MSRSAAWKILFVLLVGEDLEALHERQAGVDHRRELAREDDEIFRVDARAELKLIARRPFFLTLTGLSCCWRRRFSTAACVLGLHRALAHLAGSRSRFPGKLSHFSLDGPVRLAGWLTTSVAVLLPMRQKH